MTAALPLTRDRIAWITTEQMREVDRVMTEDLRIELIQMMENAGRNLARLVLDLFDPRTVAVYAGPGGNGGGGLAAARHLANTGADVSVVLARPSDALTAVPAHQLDILVRMGVPVGERAVPADVAVDALIGYGLAGDPRGRTGELVEAVNGTGVVVALDAPSGLDTGSGRVGTPCVSATATLTLALPKVGLREAPQVGRLYLADISVPPAVYQEMGIDSALVPDFRGGPLLLVDRTGRDWLADLLDRTAAAHHRAYRETDGVDPEWAIWYAGHLQAHLPDPLARCSRSQLTAQLLEAEDRRRSSGSPTPGPPSTPRCCPSRVEPTLEALG